MALSGILRWMNKRSTADLIKLNETIRARGIFKGGTVAPGVGLTITVSSFRALSFDGMIVDSSATETLTVLASNTNYIVTRAKYNPLGTPVTPTLSMESLTAAAYAGDPDINYLIVHAVVTLGAVVSVVVADISLVERDTIDPQSRSKFRGSVDTSASLPTPASPTNLIGDVYLVEDVPELKTWDGATWTTVTAGDTSQEATVTIGDGVISFGDFNGPTALQDALDALPAGGGKIVAREGTYTITTAVSKTNRQVILEGMGGGATVFDFQLGAATVGLTLGGAGLNIYLRDLSLRATAGATTDVLNMRTDGGGGLNNVQISGKPWSIRGNGSYVVDSVVATTAGTIGDSILITGTVFVRNCSFSAAMTYNKHLKGIFTNCKLTNTFTATESVIMQGCSVAVSTGATAVTLSGSMSDISVFEGCALSTTPSGIVLQSTHTGNLTIRDSVLLGSGTSVNINLGAGNNVTIANNYIAGNTGKRIAIGATTLAQLNIVGNVFGTGLANAQCIDLTGAAAIDELYVEDNQLVAFTLSDGTSRAAFDLDNGGDSPDRCVVRGNILKGAVETSGRTTGIIVGGDELLINGNIIDGYSTGIETTTNADTVVLSDNIITAPSINGIKTNNGSDRVVIKGNIISDVDSADTTFRAINVIGATSAIVADNIIFDIGTDNVGTRQGIYASTSALVNVIGNKISFMIANVAEGIFMDDVAQFVINGNDVRSINTSVGLAGARGIRAGGNTITTSAISGNTIFNIGHVGLTGVVQGILVSDVGAAMSVVGNTIGALQSDSPASAASAYISIIAGVDALNINDNSILMSLNITALDGIVIDGSAGTTDTITVSGNTIRNSCVSGQAIRVTESVTTEGKVVISGNSIRQLAALLFDIGTVQVSASNVAIVGNVIHYVGNIAGTAIALLGTHNNLTVTGNNILFSGTGVGNIGVLTDNTSTLDTVTISGNTIFWSNSGAPGTNTAGIDIDDGTSNIAIDGNTVSFTHSNGATGTNWYGIDYSGAFGSITGNRFLVNRLANTNQNGIILRTASHDTVVLDNNCRRTTTPGSDVISDSGTQNIVGVANYTANAVGNYT